MTIGTVLLLVTVGSLAVFTLVAMAFFHMRFSNVVVNQRSARNIAESALSTALTEVWNDNEYGSERELHHFLHLKSTTDENAEAFLSFNVAKAEELGVPFSTNNFQSEASVTGGNGRVVPDSAVHLVAVGKCRGARYRAEMLYYVPPYPNAMASSGPVISTGGLLVAGITSVEKAVEITGPDGVDEDSLDPGHVISNSSSPDAIYIGPDSEIRGDVVAVGGIRVGKPVQILGEVRPNAGEQPIPELGIDSVFEKLDGLHTKDTIDTASLPGDTHIDYFTEAKSRLRVNGDLYLDGGVLYCHDDLVVTGEVIGHGAVFCLGDVKIEAGANLSANDQIALVAKGSLELQGASKDTQFYNGLIYSEREILASDITVVGAAVVNGDRRSELHLNNVNLIKSPVSTELVMGLPKLPKIQNGKAPDKSEKDGRFLIFGSKKTTTVSPPDINDTLARTLVAGVQVSGMRLPKKDGKETFSIQLEGVFTRGDGVLNSVDELTPEERKAIKVDDYDHFIQDGRLHIRYDRQVRMEKKEILAEYNTLVSELESGLAPPISYTITKTKKSFLRKKKSKETVVVDPAFGLKPENVKLGAFLDSLLDPKKATGPDYIDLSLNRVLDPAETSQILLWKSF